MKSYSKKHWTRVIAVAAGTIGAVLILSAWQLPPFKGSVEKTDNAYVRGSVTIISPQVTGYVTGVRVRDFQEVRAGDLLVQIDDRIHQQKLMQARANLATKQAALKNSAQSKIRSSEAQIESAKAAYELASINLKRIKRLAAQGYSSQSDADKVRSVFTQSEASLHEAEAALDVSRQALQSVIVNRDSLEADIQNADAAIELAAIDLRNTRIVAPVDGKLGEIGVEIGQYVSAGTQLAAIIPKQRWIIANFKETQVAGMAVGQPISFTVDALRRTQFSGRLEAFSPAAGSEFSVIKGDNATGNFTKVTQRIPVRIAIDAGQALAARLEPGMSVVVSVDTGSQG